VGSALVRFEVEKTRIYIGSQHLMGFLAKVTLAKRDEERVLLDDQHVSPRGVLFFGAQRLGLQVQVFDALLSVGNRAGVLVAKLRDCFAMRGAIFYKLLQG